MQRFFGLISEQLKIMNLTLPTESPGLNKAKHRKNNSQAAITKF